MARTFVLLTCALALLASVASAEIIEHSFHVGNLTIRQLCREQVITAVNGSLPGPTIRAREGDTLIIHVINNSPYNMTIHWHGVLQLLSAWADGPQFVTQCPILPGNSYTYKFTLDRQEGTLWWHAHVSWLRATVYGALIIRPRSGRSYPFPKPYREFPILLGEWWNGNVVDIVNAGLASGSAPAVSDAYTINGKPGDQYPCPQNQTYTVKVVQGKTYLLRIINAALNNQLFFKIANHQLTVVAVDAAYTEPYHTDVIVLAPGQTADVLLIANQPPAYYYMAARAYASAPQLGFNPTTTTAILQYEDAVPATPLMPVLPNHNDTATAHTFYTNLTSLTTGPHWTPVPRDVDEHMFVTEGLGLLPCGPNPMCNATRFAASMNNVSFQPPSTLSMLEAFFNGVSGIYTEDFPDRPPVVFDYTGSNLSSSLLIAEVGTRVKKLRYNTTVEIVLQNTALIAAENHPIHLHGFNFYVLAQGFGNYNPKRDRKIFNLVNPQERNTIGVPVGGWAVIRFRADNPGVWLMHCHLDLHLPWGLATAFVVENGPTPSSTLPPPPEDLPKCQK